MDFCQICKWDSFASPFMNSKQREFKSFGSMLQHFNACHYDYPPPCGNQREHPSRSDPWAGYLFECTHKNKKNGDTTHYKWYDLNNNTIYRKCGNDWESE